MLLLFPVEPLSVGAMRCVEARYGDADRFEEWLATRSSVETIPHWINTWSVFAASRSAPSFDVVLRTVIPALPRSNRDPAPSDCDERGVCRCGCGAEARIARASRVPDGALDYAVGAP